MRSRLRYRKENIENHEARFSIIKKIKNKINSNKNKENQIWSKN
jgi:hypothetical protein